MRDLALAVAFLLELLAFAAFAGAGFLLPGGRAVQSVAAIAMFAALIAFWSLFMAPRAARKVGGTPYYAAKLGIYLIAAYVIFAFAGTTFGLAFVVAALVDEAVLFGHNLSRWCAIGKQIDTAGCFMAGYYDGRHFIDRSHYHAPNSNALIETTRRSVTGQSHGVALFILIIDTYA